MQNDVLAPVGVEHDLGLLERRRVIVEAAHHDRRRRHEAVAAGDVAGRDAVDLEAHDLGLLGLRAEGADDRHGAGAPSAATRLAEAAPQRIDFGQGKERTICGHDLREHVLRRPARLLDDGDIELALLRVALDVASVSEASPAP